MLHPLSYVCVGVPPCLLDDEKPLDKVEVGGLHINDQDLFKPVARVGRQGVQGGQLLWCDHER